MLFFKYLKMIFFNRKKQYYETCFMFELFILSTY